MRGDPNRDAAIDHTSGPDDYAILDRSMEISAEKADEILSQPELLRELIFDHGPDIFASLAEVLTHARTAVIATEPECSACLTKLVASTWRMRETIFWCAQEQEYEAAREQAYTEYLESRYEPD